MASIGSLTADLRLESASFTRDIAKATSTISKSSKRMEQDMRRVKKAAAGVNKSFSQLKNAAGALAGALAVRQFVRFTSAAIDSADAIAKTSKQLGVATDALQRYRIEASLAGVETAQVDKALGAFTKRVGELRVGTGALATLLGETNVQLEAQLKAASSTEVAFRLMLQAIDDAPTSFDKVALSAAAFSRTAGIAMVNLAANVGQLDAEMVQLVTRSSEVLAAGEKLKDEFTLLSESFSVGFDTALITNLTGSVQAAADTMRQAQQIGEDFGFAVGQAMRALAVAARIVGQNLRELVTIITGLIAMKLASFLIGASIAMLKFGKTILAVSRGTLLLSTIMRRSGIGALASIVISITAAAAAWEAFGEDAVAAMDRMTGGMDDQLAAMGELSDVTDDLDSTFEDFMKTQRDHLQIAEHALRAHHEGAEAVALHEAAVVIFNQEIAAGIELTTEQRKEMAALIIATNKQVQALEDVKEAEQDASDAAADYLQTLRDQERAAQEAYQQPFLNAIGSVQGAFADMFESVFEGGVNSFGELANAVKRIMIKLAAEVATLMVFRPIVGGTLSASGLPGLGAQLTGSPIGGGSGGGLGSFTGGGIPTPPTSFLGDGFGIGSSINSFGSSFGFAQTASSLTAAGSGGGAFAAGVAGPPSLAGGTFGATTLTGMLGGVGAGFGTGMFVNSLLGGNETGGMVGSGLGATAGAIIGSVVPVIGTVIGGMIGGALGGAVGGLFGSSGGVGPNAAARVIGSSVSPELGFRIGGSGADNGGNLAGVKAEAQKAVDALNGIKDALDLGFTNTVSQTLGATNNFIGQGRGVGGFRSAEALVNAFMSRGGFSSENKDIERIVKGSTAKTLQENITLLSSIPGLIGPVTSAFDLATKAVNDNFDKIAEKATKFGLSITKVEAGRAKAMEDLRLQAQAPFIADAMNVVQFLNAQSLSGGSSLSPTERLAEAQRQYEDILGRVQGGEAGLGGALTSAASNFLAFGRAQFASSGAFAGIESSVRGDLLDVAENISSEDFFQAQIEATRQQTEVIADGQDQSNSLLDILIKEIQTLRREMAA